jgi:beta-lactam-binding protein with PASTA domain
MRPRIVVFAAVAVMLVAPSLRAQEPRAGQGPFEAAVVVPRVSNKTVQEARQELEALGLRLESDHPVDERRAVVTRQQPPTGSRVPRGTVVKVTTTTPLAMVVVPDLTGQTAAEAKRTLELKGIVARTTGGTGRVLTQQPPPGAKVPQGTVVTVVAGHLPESAPKRAPAPPEKPSAPPTVPLPSPAPPPRSEPAPPPRSAPTVPLPSPARPPSSAPEAPPVSAPPTASIDELLARLGRANIAFNAPKQLQLHEIAVIQLLLSVREPIEALQRDLQGPGERIGAEVRISTEMEAHLSGTGFKVEPITPERQAISEKERTEWSWQVEPTRTGVMHLQLTLSANLDVAGRSVPRTIRTFEQRIDVEVTWRERTLAFIGGNWQWLWTAILIPLFAWGYRRLRRRGSRRREDRLTRKR